MRVGSGEHTYEWVDHWANIPDTESSRTGWAHHGIVVTEAGIVVAFHQGDPVMLLFDNDGALQRSWEIDLNEAHGITVVKECDTEYLWLSDSWEKPKREDSYKVPAPDGPVSGQVMKTTLDGSIVMRLPRPDLPIYRDGHYMPTSVAVNEERHGGNGDIWVADGYGQKCVHRYDKAGNYISSINGEEGTEGHYNLPHGVFIDRRKSEPELYVADRWHRPVHVYDLDGNFKRAFGMDFLTSASGFVTYGDFLIIAELGSRLAVLDGDDEIICYLGDNSDVTTMEGWPIEGWPNVPAAHIEPGKFNSPHSIAVDKDGNLYVSEWLIGGRITKLVKS